MQSKNDNEDRGNQYSFVKMPAKRPQQQEEWQINWILAAFMATAGFVCSSFFAGIVSVRGLIAKPLASLGYLFIISFVLAFKYKSFVDTYGRAPKFQDTLFYDKEKQMTKRTAVICGVIMGPINFVGAVCTIFAFKHALLAAMNQGLVTAITSASSIFVTIGSFLLYRESISLFQGLGICMLTTSVTLISMSKGEEHVEEGMALETPLWMILLAISATFCFSLRTLIQKYLSKHEKIDGISAGLASTFGDIICSAVVTVYLLFTSMDVLRSMFFLEYVTATCSGMFTCIAVLFINVAVHGGLAGPASAIAGTQSLFMTLLCWMILGQSLNGMEVVGLLVGLIGMLSVSIGDQIYRRLLGTVKTDSESETLRTGLLDKPEKATQDKLDKKL